MIGLLMLVFGFGALAVIVGVVEWRAAAPPVLAADPPPNCRCMLPPAADPPTARDVAWQAFEAETRADHLAWRWAGGCGDTPARNFPDWSVR